MGQTITFHYIPLEWFTYKLRDKSIPAGIVFSYFANYHLPRAMRTGNSLTIHTCHQIIAQEAVISCHSALFLLRIALNIVGVFISHCHVWLMHETWTWVSYKLLSAQESLWITSCLTWNGAFDACIYRYQIESSLQHSPMSKAPIF